MQKIRVVDRLLVSVIPGERKPGESLVYPLVSQVYKEKGYDTAPKNGLMSSFLSIRFYASDAGWIVSADIMATRYFLGQAVRDIAKESGDGEARDASVDMANVSLLAPTIYKGEPVLIAQVKGGKVLGAGQIHAAMTAGNIPAKYLPANNPLIKTLEEETSEEVGLDLSTLNPSSFCFMVDERETGQVNFAAVASGVDFEKVMVAYQDSIKGKPLAELEVMGLAIIPIRNAQSIRENIEIFEPDGNGGMIQKTEKRGLRPYTEAVIDWLEEHVSHQDLLIKKAGI